MFIVETNAHEVAASLRKALEGAAGVLQTHQRVFEETIQDGIRQHFGTLGDPAQQLMDIAGEPVHWEGISGLTAEIRPDVGIPVWHPTLLGHGTMMEGAVSGTTTVLSSGDDVMLSYLPGQLDKITKHEEGFVVTWPSSRGLSSPPRPIIFWSTGLADSVEQDYLNALTDIFRREGFL